MAFVATAVFAVEGAIAAVSVTSVAAAVASVGAAMTVVGTITKSKELVSVGKVMSIAGGVTSLVSGGIAALTADVAADGLASSAASGAAGALDSLGADAAAGAADALGGTAASTGASGIAEAAQSAVGKFDLTASNFGFDTSLMKGVSEPLSAGVTDFAGAAKAAAPSFAPVAGQTVGDLVTSAGPVGISTPAGMVGADDGSWFGELKSKLGSTWDRLPDNAKAELLKAGLSIPGAIQNQKNTERAFDLQQQKVNQTSHASEVPVFGIIQRAQKAGGG